MSQSMNLAFRSLLGILAMSVVACSPAAPAAPATSAPAAKQAAAKPMEPQKVTVSMAAYSASYAPYLVAIEKGYYRDEGIELEVIQQGGGQSVPALLGGHLDFNTSSGSATNAAIAGGDVVTVWNWLTSPNYEVWSSKPSIDSIDDVPGKTVAVRTQNDADTLVMRLFFRKKGIDPDSVTYTPLGTTEARNAAIVAGSVDIAPISPYEIEVRGAPKGHRLGTADDLAMAYTGLSVSGRVFRDNPDLVKRFLRASTKGWLYFEEFPDATIPFIQKWSELSPEVIQSDVQSVLPTANKNPDGSVANEVLEAELRTRADLLKDFKGELPAVEKIWDYSLAKEAYQDIVNSGWKPQK